MSDKFVAGSPRERDDTSRPVSVWFAKNTQLVREGTQIKKNTCANCVQENTKTTYKATNPANPEKKKTREFNLANNQIQVQLGRQSPQRD